MRRIYYRISRIDMLGVICQYQSAWTARAHTTGNGEGD